MAPNKKQHYTPNFILRRFADDATRTLWIWDKCQRTCRPVRGTPRYDALAQNDYYTLKDTSGNHDLSVEHSLANIEDAAAHIIDKLIDIAATGLYHPLNLKKTECLARFLVAQHMRSPAARSEIVNSEETKQMYHDLIHKNRDVIGRGSRLPCQNIRRSHGSPRKGLEASNYQ